MKSTVAVSGIVLSLSIGLIGCYKTVRTVPMATVPAKYRTASAAELENLVQDRDAAIKTLYARVEINVTSGGSHTGTQTEAGRSRDSYWCASHPTCTYCFRYRCWDRAGWTW